MEKKNPDLMQKMVIMCITGVCAVYLVFVNHGEGVPYILFSEVTVNDTINRSVIHPEDKDRIQKVRT